MTTQLWSAPSWESGFQDPAPEYGMGVYWWWFGPAVTKPEVTRELEVMQRAGISYVLIFPIYPISVDDPARGIRNLRYLSPEFQDVLAHATAEARRLKITADVLLGTGWPYGGPSITPALGAKRLKVVVSPVATGAVVNRPALEAEEKLEAALLVRGHPKQVNLAGAIDVTNRLGTGLRQDRPGDWVLMTFIQSPTRMQVKRPSLGAEGLVMDHLNRKALDTYIASVGEPLLRLIKPGTIRAIHSDSMEVYGTEWTDGFLAEFSKRRGYDLRPYLPALAIDAGPLTADVRNDYWRTVGELAVDNYVRPLQQWAHSRGLQLQAESYGNPPVDMGSYAGVDLPMGEHYQWKMFDASRWASSAAHQMGIKSTSAEAYTWLRHPRYISTLQDLKLGSDLHFISGVTKMVAHGYAYSPPSEGIPGWGYYASVMLNDNNPFWPYFRYLSDYVRRVSYVLTLGKPAAGVALYLPEDDVMAGQPVGNGLNLYMSTKDHLGDGRSVPEFGLPAALQSESPVIKTLITSGFTFDGIDRGLLRSDLKTAAGRLEIGDVAYRIAVLPNLRGISLPMLEKLADFCRNGGVLIATRRLPEAAYGVRDRDANYARVRQLVSEIFGDGSTEIARRHAFGRGVAIYVPDEGSEFAKVLAALRPEIRFAAPDADLAFLHRGEAKRHLYFLTNTSAKPKSLQPVFRDGEGQPQIWDAMNGVRSAVRHFDSTPAGTRVPIELEPYGSTIVVFDPTASPAKALPQKIAGANRSVPGPFSLRRGDEQYQLKTLRSWTDIDALRFFSGRADYEFEIELPQSLFGKNRGVWLDLGDVREIADVKVNGQAVGARWKLPYRVDLSSAARPGRNRITVGVTNLPINRVIGSPTPDYRALEPLRFPFPQEKKLISEPVPSGLLGPVQVIPYEIR